MAESTKIAPLSTPKGTHDLLPQELATWQYVERIARALFQAANVKEIRTPLFEATHLFERGVGEATDIVNKEMYSFEKGDRKLTLRPENTAGVVRSYIQHGMDRWPKPVKLFYIGPMFRYERPQAGRQRQFHQVGLELFGLDTPQSDAAAILLAYDFLNRLGLQGVTLDINNVGCFECRESFRGEFRRKLTPFLSKLCSDCQTRYELNPLRMLDCKNSECKAIYAQPEVAAFLADDQTCGPCQSHFLALLGILVQLGVPYQQNKMLVRGLDYYTRTVFEFTSTHLGAQNAVCGGGRYNELVRTLGGPDTPAVGWAMGMERLVSLIAPVEPEGGDYYIASDDPASALLLARELQHRGISAEVDLSGKALGKQIAQANKLGARHVVILGESERSENRVTVKTMATGEQHTLDKAAFLASLVSPSAEICPPV